MITLQQWHLSRGGIYYCNEVKVLEAEKMGKHKDLSDHDEGQIVMAKQLGQSISQKKGLVGCSQYAVVSTY